MSEQQNIAPTDEATVPPIATGNVESVPTSKRPTPRTDAEYYRSCGSGHYGPSVPIDFARGLERELAEAQEQRDRLAEALAKLNDLPLCGAAYDLIENALATRGQAEPEKEPESEWSEWIEWNGGECPVQPETRVCIRVRDGWEDWEENAGYWKWKHLGAGGDIIAYRVRKGGSK